jgi:hypothetical protein
VTILRAAIVFASITLASSSPALAQGAAPKAARASAPVTHVYLMRGFMNIFSLGMDTLAERLQKRGIKAEVYNHIQSDSVVSEIIRMRRAGDRGPVVLVGHSLGAGAVVSMANELSAAGVTADLVVPLDAISTMTALGNTKRIVNYYLSDGVGAPVVAGPGFKGSIRNVDVRGQGIGHMSIDKSDHVQSLIVNQVIALGRPATPRPTKTAVPAGATAEKPETTATIPTLR